MPDEPGAASTLLDRTTFGTLVVRAEALPARPEARARFFREIAANTYKLRLMLVVPPRELERGTLEALVGADLRSLLVEVRIPALAERASDLPRIVESAIAFHAGPAVVRFTAHDRQCLEARAWPDEHAEIEETISRLVVLRKTDSLSRAAGLAGLKKSGLSMWAKKSGFEVAKSR